MPRRDVPSRRHRRRLPTTPGRPAPGAPGQPAPDGRGPRRSTAATGTTSAPGPSASSAAPALGPWQPLPPAQRGGLHGLTEGAILAALVAVLALATRYLPLVGLVTTFLCPLPLAVLVIRHGLRVAVIAAVVAALVSTALAGPIVGAAILISFAPMGVTIGVGASRGWPASRVVSLGALVSAVSTAASFLGLAGGGATSPQEFAREMAATMERSMETAGALYVRLGASRDQIDAMKTQYRDVVRLLPYLLPTILVMSATMSAWLNYEVGRRVLQRFGYHLAALPPMRAWRLPAWAVWGLPAGFGLVMLSQVFRLGVLQAAGNALSILTAMVFTLQGILVAWVLLGNLELSPRERTVAVVIAFSLSTALPLISVLFLTLGLLDSAARIRDRWGLPRSAATKVEP